MPNETTSSSTVVPPAITLAVSRYMLGVVGLHSLGIGDRDVDREVHRRAGGDVLRRPTSTGASAVPLDR